MSGGGSPGGLNPVRATRSSQTSAIRVSTQIQHAVPAFDEIIRPGDEDFPPSGLKAVSVIRLGFLAVLPRDHFSGKIGSIASARHSQLLKNLCDHLLKKA